MSQTFFSKQDPSEKLSRLSLLGSSQGEVIVWKKGSKEKYKINALKFDRDRSEIVLDSKKKIFSPNEKILCSFELSGMTFFSEVISQISISDHLVLQFTDVLFKSERRSSYRLLTYPLYEVWADFDLDIEQQSSAKIVDIKSRVSQTGLFKSFLKLVEGSNSNGEVSDKLSIRVQDLSTTGMALHVGEVEVQFFSKDMIFKDVDIRFADETIRVPEVKIVYIVDFNSSDKNIKKYKLGINFPNLPTKIDDLLGKKINKLLRENDFNKDFENFIK